MTVHPLLLQELLLITARDVEPKDYLICALVCKAWNAFFSSLIWEKCTIDHSQTISLSTDPKVVIKHACHIRTLIHHGIIPSKHLSIRFPNLKTLDIQNNNLSYVKSSSNIDNRAAAMSMWSGVAGLIAQSPSLTEVRISANHHILTEIIWDAIRNNKSVAILHIKEVGLNLKQAPLFWSACTKLEKLEIIDCAFSGRSSSLQQTLPESFPALREVIFHRFMVYSRDLVNMIARCPQLQHFYWRRWKPSDTFDFFTFNTILSTNLQKLSSLDISGGGSNDNLLSATITKLSQPAIKLSFPKTRLGPFSLKALLLHSHTLREIDITKSCGIKSVYVGNLLQSCSNLVSFKVGWMFSMALPDELWECTKTLEILSVYIILSENRCPVEESRRVMKFLARFKSLRELDLSGHIIHLRSIPRMPLQLKLARGLDQLSTLSQLERFYFSNHGQRMGIEDGLWIMENWKKLEIIKGKFNEDQKVNREIYSMFSHLPHVKSR